jgi:hypothetical protein
MILFLFKLNLKLYCDINILIFILNRVQYFYLEINLYEI